MSLQTKPHLKRRLIPPPIRIPAQRDIQPLDEEAKKTSPLLTDPLPTPTARPSSSSQHPVSSSRVSASTLSALRTTADPPSPTKTTVLTVTTTCSRIKSPDEKQASPERTDTVFVSLTASPQLITVTVPAETQISSSATSTTRPIGETNSSGTTRILNPIATRLLISLVCIAALGLLLVAGIVFWRRRARKAVEKEVDTTQDMVFERNSGGFREIPDPMSIVARE